MFSDLQNYLQQQISNLNGEWVNKRSNYESPLCDVLLMSKERGRYWDAKWNQLFLEFKKGKSIWLDLVRYSEILLRTNENACQDVLTLFFIPNSQKTKIDEIICVETCAILDFIKLNEEYANLIIQLNNHVPRQLNAQASLTLKDIKKIQAFSVQ